MKIRDCLKEDSKVYIKSEFGPISSDWPALSFSKEGVVSKFNSYYRAGKDFVLAVGTGNPKNTKTPEHRKSLLSFVSVEPRSPLATEDLIPEESWEKVLWEQQKERWKWSLPIERCYEIVGYPLASDIIPQSYSSLSSPETWGNCVALADDEYENLVKVEIEEIELELSKKAKSVLSLNTRNDALNFEINRLEGIISGAIERSGCDRKGKNPIRTRTPNTKIYIMLNRKWESQNGICALCGKEIPLQPRNRLLQMSADRVSSENKAYDAENVHITHLACNLAKSDVSLKDWDEYLRWIREE